MDLDLGSLRTRGRAVKPVEAEIVRELDATDLVLCATEKGSKASPIKRLSDRHHALARNIAGGMAPGEAAIVCGYDNSRVSILLADPTFNELLEFYRKDVNNTYLGMHERLFGVAMDALGELASRLEETPDTLSVGQLIEVAKMGADRSGHGPQSQTTNLNVNVDMAGRLEAARKRVAERRAQVIEGEVNDRD